MRLMTAHKILIGTGCVFFLFFALVQWMGMAEGRGSPIAATLGLLASLALVLYFRTLKGK